LEKKFCIIPFVELELQPKGDVYVCCHSENPEQIGSLKEDSFIDIWNSQKLKDFRQKILDGKINELDHCADCLACEDKGMKSWRTVENKNWGETTLKMQEKPEVTEFPQSLSLRFSNVCNFACRTCKPATSTGWFEDAKILNPKGHYQKVISYNEGNPVSKQVIPYLSNVKHIYMGGGEPLLDEDHYILLKEIAENHPHIQISYDSNLSILGLGKFKVLDLWKKIKTVRLTASVDGYGKKGEYIRKGFSWKNYLDNWNKVKEVAPNVSMQMNFTISIYNIFHVLEFIEEVKRLGMYEDNNPDDFEISLVKEPIWLSIKSLSEANKQTVYKKVTEYVANNDFGKTNNHLMDAMKYMMAGGEDLEKAFVQYTKRIDFIRNEKYTDLFCEENRVMNFFNE